jgi:subtilisin family serine protease
LKVLASDGTGSTSDLLRAYEWLYYNARALGIRVVNLSLTGGGGDTDPQCEWTAALARQGITVVAASGNNKANMMGEAPGACPKALAVRPRRAGPAGCGAGARPASRVQPRPAPQPPPQQS